MNLRRQASQGLEASVRDGTSRPAREVLRVPDHRATPQPPDTCRSGALDNARPVTRSRRRKSRRSPALLQCSIIAAPVRRSGHRCSLELAKLEGWTRGTECCCGAKAARQSAVRRRIRRRSRLPSTEGCTSSWTTDLSRNGTTHSPKQDRSLSNLQRTSDFHPAFGGTFRSDGGCTPVTCP